MSCPAERWEEIRRKLIAWAKCRTADSDKSWITVREAARRLGLRQDEVIEMVEASEGLDLLVGIRTNNGIGTYDCKGDYQIEWFQEERT